MSQPDLESLYAEANRAMGEGRLEDCDRLCGQILNSVPMNVSVLVMAGISADRQNRSSEAVSLFQRAVRSDPNCAPALLWLSMTERKAGNLTAALGHAGAAARLNPNDSFTMNQLGQCQYDLGEFPSAEATFRRAITLAPNITHNHLGLGLALRALNRPVDAATALRRAAELDASDWRPRHALRDLLVELEDLPAAINVGREVVNLLPASPEDALWLATAVLEHGSPGEAEELVQTAQRIEPLSAEARTSLGIFFQRQGKLLEAEEQFKASIELAPRQAAPYLSIATNRKILGADRPFVESIRMLLKDSSLSPWDRSRLYYALGKSLEDLAEYQGAMEAYDEANCSAYQARFGEQTYDPSTLEPYERFAKKFAPSNNQPEDLGSPIPIFVVGMIRSGTTLAQQILSSHPEVGAAGEQNYWLSQTQALVYGSGTLENEAIHALAGPYLKRLAELAPGKPFVVDKMPTNYLLLGLLHQAFPRARFVHVRRNPADTCISIYATPNRVRAAWTHDKQNIVSQYRRYERLMNQWRRVLGPSLVEARYEDLVSSPESSIRALVRACGLQWDESCLRPEENESAVNTPSVTQVRRPVYKTSMERWKRFEPWLGPFRELIA